MIEGNISGTLLRLTLGMNGTAAPDHHDFTGPWMISNTVQDGR